MASSRSKFPNVFFPGWATCNHVVASNIQDAMLVDLAAKVRPGVPVLFWDSAYHFMEIIGTHFNPAR